jgi:hypothetical protein
MSEEIPDPAPERSPTIVERAIATLFEESTLWPILVVVLGHVAAFLAPVVILALRERRPSAGVAFVGAIVLSGLAVRAEWSRAGRPGPQAAFVALAWLLTGVFAWAANHWQVF